MIALPSRYHSPPFFLFFSCYNNYIIIFESLQVPFSSSLVPLLLAVVKRKVIVRIFYCLRTKVTNLLCGKVAVLKKVFLTIIPKIFEFVKQCCDKARPARNNQINVRYCWLRLRDLGERIEKLEQPEKISLQACGGEIRRVTSVSAPSKGL